MGSENSEKSQHNSVNRLSLLGSRKLCSIIGQSFPDFSVALAHSGDSIRIEFSLGSLLSVLLGTTDNIKFDGCKEIYWIEDLFE